MTHDLGYYFNPSITAKCLVICGLMIICSFSANAQKQNNANALSWYQYKGDVDLGNRFSVVLDFQHRRQDFVNYSNQQVLRPGLAYTLKSSVKFTLGTALFWHNINGQDPVYRPEVRPYTFVEWKQPLGKIQVTHRFRFELRYNRKTAGAEVLEGYNFNYRAGHRLGLSIPLQSQKVKDLRLEIYDEVLINFGERIRFNYLDQNRIYAGIKGRLTGRSTFKLGYMYIFVPSGSSVDFVTQHILVLGIGHKW